MTILSETMGKITMQMPIVGQLNYGKPRELRTPARGMDIHSGLNFFGQKSKRNEMTVIYCSGYKLADTN